MGEALAELLGPEKVMFYWPQIEIELKKVEARWGQYWTIDSLLTLSTDGQFQCWAFGNPIKVVCWTQVVQFPANKVLQIVLAVGNGIDALLEEMEVTFENFAHQTECTIVEIDGRDGWLRKLRKMGFEHHTTKISRRIVNRSLQ